MKIALELPLKRTNRKFRLSGLFLTIAVIAISRWAFAQGDSILEPDVAGVTDITADGTLNVSMNQDPRPKGGRSTRSAPKGAEGNETRQIVFVL